MSVTELSFGTCYHLYQAGNHRRALFREDVDYHLFLDLYRKYLRPIVDLYAYCLLPTHLHLLFRVKERKQIEYVYPEAGMLSWQLKTLFAVYTKSIDHSCSRTGGLFIKSSARRIPTTRDLVCQLIAYIHQNPQIHGVVSDFRIWPFSSCFAYLRQDRRSMIAKDLLLDPSYQHRIIKLQESSCVREANWDY
ncbi:MAG: transposase [Anaerolineales bacterium]|jgi:putative transposase